MRSLATLILILTLNITGFSCSGNVNKDDPESSDKTEKVSANIDKEKIYIGRTDEVGILIEDNRTHQKDKEFDFEDINGYVNYFNFVNGIAKTYKGDDIEVTIEDYKPEFKRLTDLKLNDKLYIATDNEVLEGYIARYYINTDDEIGSGNAFYSVADVPNALLLKTDMIVIASRDKITSPINTKKVTDAGVIDKAMEVMKPKTKGMKMTDFEGNIEQEVDVKLSSEDFTAIALENGDYAVGFNKRLNFDTYISCIFIMNSSGEVTNWIENFTEPKFDYTTLMGVIDLNGDGELEYLVETGYYEGAGYGLYKSNKGVLEAIATGFFFGV